MTTVNRIVRNIGGLISIFLLLVACATESHRSLKPEVVATHKNIYNGSRYTLMVGRFQNRSGYMNGLFSEGKDQLGSQAKTILKTHLQQSGRFIIVDRENMTAMAQEAKIRGQQQHLKGAQVAITGGVTEFARRVTGDTQLFGILGHGKKQLAYAKVALNVVDVNTSEVIYTTQGGGEYDLSNRQIFGTGSSAGYDATLNEKVLNLAIMEAVNHLVDDLQSGVWTLEKGR